MGAPVFTYFFPVLHVFVEYLFHLRVDFFRVVQLRYRFGHVKFV
jgi:hypothetical protein